jgi:hypothetical protein
MHADIYKYIPVNKVLVRCYYDLCWFNHDSMHCVHAACLSKEPNQ